MSASNDPSLRFLLGWQAATLLLVLLLPVAILGDWPWQLERKEILPFAALVAAFGLSALFQLAIRGQSGWQRLALAILGTAAIFSAPLLWLVITRASSSRVLLLAIFAVSLAFLTIPFVGGRALRAAGVLVLGITMAGTAALGGKRHLSADRQVATSVESFASTNLYNLSLTTHQARIPRPAVRGGGFARMNGGILLATGDGYLYRLHSRERALDVETLPYRVPLNGEEFAAAVGREYREPTRQSEYGPGAPPLVQTWRFRVGGVLVQELPERTRLFASHHYWKDAEKCFTMRVSLLDLPPAGASQAERAGWRTLFEAVPCLPLTGPDAKRGKNPFQGEDTGGRLALLDEHTLLLTTGDLGFSGLESWQLLSQDPDSSFGKTLRIDVNTGESSIFTTGHRNAQGLLLDGEQIWITEHGPKGGDELNLLVEGANYGWPLATYGTEYQSFVWPLNPQQGRHEGYPGPVFAWVPSIGVTELIRVSGDRFPDWRGDFLVGSLATRSLYRLRLENERVVFSEPIPIAERVRDLIELDDGRILVWTDSGSIVEIGLAAEMNGALLFGSLCANCHWINDGLSHRMGPDLHGVVNRQLAGAPGFEYSPALRSAGGRWTDARLDAYLADPQAAVPGTSMAAAGVEDERQRALIIEYLRQTTE